MTALDEKKFGCFIHWGPYSVGGVEASWPVMLGPELQRRFVEALHRVGMEEVEMPPVPVTKDEYEGYPARFTAERFDAEEWVDLFRDAGQRYCVFTTKHHDGFAMFDTKTTDYKITNTPFGRDAVAELAAACQAGGVALGTYFSAPDIADPGYRDLTRPVPETFLGQPERPEWSEFLDRMETQVRELCTDYGDLYSMWWDVGFGPEFSIERFHSLVRDLQPNTLQNDRLGGLARTIDERLRADFLTPEQTVPRSIPRWSNYPGPQDPAMVFSIIQQDNWEEIIDQIAPILKAHFDAPADATVPADGDLIPWEACMTFGGLWAYSPDLPKCKTEVDIITNLVEVASRGGNLLMNVGPGPDGTIQPEFATALRGVGRWLAERGEGIYGTTYGPIQGRDDLRTTVDDGHVYLHLLPEAEPVLTLPADLGVVGGRVLGTDATVTVTADEAATTVDLGRAPRHEVITTVALDRG